MIKLNLKQIIYTSIFMVFMALSSLTYLLFYSTSSSILTQKLLSKISKIEEQNKLALSFITNLSMNQNKILLAKDEKSFTNIEGNLLKDISSLKKMTFNGFEAYEDRYNNLISLLKDELNALIIIQNNFFTNEYSFLIDKEELKIRSNINKILIQDLYLKVENIENLESFNRLLKDFILQKEEKELVLLEERLKRISEKLLLKNEKSLELKKLIKNKNRLINKKFALIKNKIFLDKSMFEHELLANKVFKKINKINELQKEVNKTFIVFINKRNFKIKSLTGLIIILSIISLFVFSSLLISRVNKPLSKIIKKMNEILNNDKKLKENIEHKYDDEYKILANTFNNMTTKLALNIEELKIKDEKISQMNKNLEKLVKKRTKELSLKSQKVSDLLNNASQGFLSFSSDLKIDDEYSKECEKFLKKDLVRENIADILFEKENKKEFYKETLKDALSQEESLLADTYLRIMPSEIILNRRALLLDFKIIENNRIMLIITNISAKKKLEKKIKEEQERVKMIVAIISNSSQFYEILESFEDLLLQIEYYKNNGVSKLEDLNYYYRQIHTFKGLFSQVYMGNLVSYLHEIESEIKLLIEEKDFLSLKDLLDKKNLEEYLSYDLETISSILGKGFLSDRKIIKVEEENFNYLEKLIDALCSSDTLNPIYKDLAIQIKRFKQKTFHDVFYSYEKLCFDEGKKLNKELYPLEIEGDSSLFMPNEFKDFSKSLVHIFRNLIDHGIEKSEIRIEKGKDSFGLIKCIFQEQKNSYLIQISDDGRGIDIEKIKEKAIDLKLYSQAEINKFTKEEVLFLIFEDSFSTKEQISKLSGRGVGMAALKGEVDTLCGSIQIESEINKGTNFIFTLPKGK